MTGLSHLPIANLERRCVVGGPAVVPICSEFCFGMNSRAAPGADGAARSRLPIPSLVLASKRPALSLL